MFWRSEHKPVPVTLHIYDLGSQFAGVNVVCKAIGTGAFHAGVEVYHTEWSYGGSSNGPTGTGIFHCPPRGCEAHSYREAVDMGTTSLTKQQVKELISVLKKEWKGDHYDLLRHNCCHFADTLCVALGVGHVPGWVTSLAGVGAMLRSGVRLGMQGVAGAPMLAVDGVRAVANLFAADDTPGPTPDHSFVAGYPKGEAKGEGKGSPVSPVSPSSRASGASSSGFAPGDAVEVYSNSRRTWCRGHVKLVDVLGSGASPPHLEAVFWVPGTSESGTGEMATKKVPLASKDVRKLSPAGEEANGWSVGDWVEVFSQSKKVWCLGRVTQSFADKVRLVYQLPGATEEWFEKELDTRSQDLRKAEPEQLAAVAKPVWSKEEEAQYREAFNKLLSFSTNKVALDSDPLAEYLKTSGLPRKVLKQIWIASVSSASQADFNDFASCCRLVAHCQVARERGDARTIEVMEQAGDLLKQLLREKFLEKVPEKLPDFGEKHH